MTTLYRTCLAEGNLGSGIKAVDSTVRDSTSRNNSFGIECGNETSTACALLGNSMTKSSLAPLDGASASLGHNRGCNAFGVSCTLF